MKGGGGGEDQGVTRGGQGMGRQKCREEGREDGKELGTGGQAAGSTRRRA